MHWIKVFTNIGARKHYTVVSILQYEKGEIMAYLKLKKLNLIMLVYFLDVGIVYKWYIIIIKLLLLLILQFCALLVQLCCCYLDAINTFLWFTKVLIHFVNIFATCLSSPHKLLHIIEDWQSSLWPCDLWANITSSITIRSVSLHIFSAKCIPKYYNPHIWPIPLVNGTHCFHGNQQWNKLIKQSKYPMGGASGVWDQCIAIIWMPKCKELTNPTVGSLPTPSASNPHRSPSQPSSPFPPAPPGAPLSGQPPTSRVTTPHPCPPPSPASYAWRSECVGEFLLSV